MVHRQANAPTGGTQFITTTFRCARRGRRRAQRARALTGNTSLRARYARRPELVQGADAHFGVSARNKMSSISPISMERALSIIKEEQSVQQQRV